MDGSIVKEGFICPVCMKNLHGVVELQSHFNNSHQQEDKLIKQSLRDFIGKAKQRIKREVSEAQPLQGIYKYRPHGSVRQDIGVTTSHMTLFKRIRDERVDHLSTETNKLIIRLDKLLTKLPSDPVKRKAHERAVVAWVEDDSINLCPDCGRSFGLTRRKHHCRLCGFVLCARCSTFISATRGQKLAPPSPAGWAAAALGAAPADPAPSRASSGLSAGPLSGLLRRSGSVGSLNSMVSLVDAVTGEQQLRVCRHCDQKLAHREHQLDQQSSEPIIVQFYNQMRDMQKEIRDLIPMHNKMLESLLAGETRYHLSDANSIRVKILTTAERVDAMSKRISGLGAEDEDLSPWQRQLRARLRSAASTFLREDVISMPQLPNEQQLKELQAKLREETERQLAEEQERRRLAAAAEEAAVRRPRPGTTTTSSGRRSPESGGGQVHYDAGWSPPSVAAPSAAHPLLQQMEIVRGYIRQARSSHKYDELALFEQNLADLHAEFERVRAAAAGKGSCG